MSLEAVIPSLSPSMDIQVSSNFERYLWDLCGHNASRIASIADGLRKTGIYTVSSRGASQSRLTLPCLPLPG